MQWVDYVSTARRPVAPTLLQAASSYSSGRGRFVGSGGQAPTRC